MTTTQTTLDTPTATRVTSTSAAPRRRTARRAFGKARKLPSGRWQASYVGADGQRHTAAHTFATKTAATEWLAGQQADLLRGTWRDPRRGADTLADYLAEWLAHRVDLAPRTRAKYEYIAVTYLAARLTPRVQLGSVPLSAITPAMVREWHAAVVAETHRRAGLPRRTRPLTDPEACRLWARRAGHAVAATGDLPATVRAAWHKAGRPRPELPTLDVTPDAGRAQAAQAYALLRAALTNAAREGLITGNPCIIRRAGYTQATERTPATPVEVAQLAAAIRDRYRAAVVVAAWSGLRAGEVFALRRRDLGDLAGPHPFVRVGRAQLELPGRPMGYGPPKSSAGNRVVYLPRFVADHLTAHLAEFTDRGLDALVFTTGTGGPVRRSDRHRAYDRARRAVGLPGLHWHDLRHTGSVFAASAGASLPELQRRMGHSTVRAALGYLHASDGRDQLIADRLNEIAPDAVVIPLRPRGDRRTDYRAGQAGDAVTGTVG